MKYLVISKAAWQVHPCDEIQQAAKICEVDRGEILHQLKRMGRYDRADGLFIVIESTNVNNPED